MELNPLTQGMSYKCELPPSLGGCSEEHAAENCVYIYDSKMYMCYHCYCIFRDFYIKKHPATSPEQFDERVYFGPDDMKDIKPFVHVKADLPPKEKTMLDIVDEKNAEAEIKLEEYRYARDCEIFRLNQREYMRDYMRGYTKTDEIKKKLKLRHKELKTKFKESDIIDNTTPVCPRCEHPKCGKSGYVLNSTGKYQRRRCPACGYVYSDDWRN